MHGIFLANLILQKIVCNKHDYPGHYLSFLTYSFSCMGKTNPDEVSLHIALVFCKIQLGGCYGCNLWICNLAQKVLCSLAAEEHVSGVQYVRSSAVQQMSLSQAQQREAKERIGLERYQEDTAFACYNVCHYCVNICHTSASVFIVGCGCGEWWRRGEVWVWGGGAYRCAFICCGS